MKIYTKKIDIKSHDKKLSASLDIPASGIIKAYAMFAHCFTCTKDLHASRNISKALASSGIAVIRVDFAGVGQSEGDFASSNFSSNVNDLLVTADYMSKNYGDITILIGHSLGGLAALYAAKSIASVKAVATIGAPSDAYHLTHLFKNQLKEIKENNSIQVLIGEKNFTITKQFIDDLEKKNIDKVLENFDKALLVMHSPVDDTVSIDNASEIFAKARHPKSFISLNKADHLLSKDKDSLDAGNFIAMWARQFINATKNLNIDHGQVMVSEAGTGNFTQIIQTSKHFLIGDEPESFGSLDAGPNPYELVLAGLGACTNMTLRMYADHKKIKLGKIKIKLSIAKEISGEDRANSVRQNKQTKIDNIIKTIHVDNDLSDEIKVKLVEIADKCPVHRALKNSVIIKTEFLGPNHK